MMYLTHNSCAFSYREICTDHLDSLYAQLKSKGVTMSALIAKAVANTLTKHPLINAVYVNDDKHPNSVKYNKDANVAMAVAIGTRFREQTNADC
jgi:pyruvate dehydrogenase E2 component (dihydrolipoamide acetyltransferase)